MGGGRVGGSSVTAAPFFHLRKERRMARRRGAPSAGRRAPGGVRPTSPGGPAWDEDRAVRLGGDLAPDRIARRFVSPGSGRPVSSRGFPPGPDRGGRTPRTSPGSPPVPPAGRPPA